MRWKKLTSTAAALGASLVLAASPALAEHHRDDNGPIPLAVVGSVFGGVFWLASIPFCVVLAPTKITESFDTMVAAPWRAAIGQERDD